MILKALSLTSSTEVCHLYQIKAKVRIVGNTVPVTIYINLYYIIYYIAYIIPYCRYMFRSLFDHLQTEYTILVFGNDYINNGSVVLYSIFYYRAMSYG
jgi:hypothetical protein